MLYFALYFSLTGELVWVYYTLYMIKIVYQYQYFNFRSYNFEIELADWIRIWENSTGEFKLNKTDIRMSGRLNFYEIL